MHLLFVVQVNCAFVVCLIVVVVVVCLSQFPVLSISGAKVVSLACVSPEAVTQESLELPMMIGGCSAGVLNNLKDSITGFGKPVQEQSRSAPKGENLSRLIDDIGASELQHFKSGLKDSVAGLPELGSSVLIGPAHPENTPTLVS